jgi:hypothetical protein
MNSVGVLLRREEEPEDFFTSLTFSTLLGELTPKGKFYDSYDVDVPVAGEKIRIKMDFDRVWNAREDENFLNKIFN